MAGKGKLHRLTDEIAIALLQWVGDGGDEARSISVSCIHGKWRVRIVEEHKYSEAGGQTLNECWEQLTEAEAN